MFIKVSFLTLLFVSLSYSLCTLNEIVLSSIKWEKKCFSSEYNDSLLFVSGKKYVLQDYVGDVNKEKKHAVLNGILCFSKDRLYARLSKKSECNDCAPTVGYIVYSVVDDSLKRCSIVGDNGDIDYLLKNLKNRK